MPTRWFGLVGSRAIHDSLRWLLYAALVTQAPVLSVAPPNVGELACTFLMLALLLTYKAESARTTPDNTSSVVARRPIATATAIRFFPLVVRRKQISKLFMAGNSLWTGKTHFKFFPACSIILSRS